MNTTVLRHLIFWSILMFIDYAGYIPVWHSNTLKIGLVNYGWLFLVFYNVHFCTKEYLNRFNTERVSAITKSYYFWITLFILIVYVIGTMICDKFLLNAYYAPTVWTYCIGRIAMVSHFAVAAVFLAIYQKRKKLILTLNKTQHSLKIENEKLISQKDQLSSEKWRLLREKTKLANEVTELRLQYEEASVLNKEMTTIRTQLETEISNRQNYILVLKAELLGGLEDYRHLVRQYSDKADKLRRYQDIYGELDDE